VDEPAVGGAGGFHDGFRQGGVAMDDTGDLGVAPSSSLTLTSAWISSVARLPTMWAPSSSPTLRSPTISCQHHAISLRGMWTVSRAE
jgi:hypothetical protein